MITEKFDKVTAKLFIKAILERDGMKRHRNLRCFRLTEVSKNALIEGGWLTQKGHFYTTKNHKII